MAKPKKMIKTEAPKIVEIIVEVPEPARTPAIQPITQDFSMGDLNHLRDKINEIIKRVA